MLLDVAARQAIEAEAVSMAAFRETDTAEVTFSDVP
jgi:DNA-binding FadR family transcriptional regulator